MLNYRIIKDLRNMMLIKKSGLFDQKYYKKEYPEAGSTPLKHYYYKGFKNGNNPSKNFDNDYYLTNNPDVKAISINPLLHYILSGKKEGRIIKKAIGITIPKIYKNINKNEYSYNVCLKNTNNKRITIFLEQLNNDNKYILDIIKKINKDNYTCRIIYKNSIDYSLDEDFKNNNINNIEFTKWNNNYLLEVYKNEIFICNNYKILLALLNTNYIKKPIYFYIDKKENYLEKEINYLSLLLDNNYIKCIGNNTNIKKSNLISNKHFLKKDKINICINFDDFSIEMFDMLQSYILNNKATSKAKLFYHSNNFYKTICLPNDAAVTYITNYDNMDLIINLSQNNITNKENNVTTISFEKNNNEISIYKIDDIISNKQEILTFKSIKLGLFEEVGDNNV